LICKERIDHNITQIISIDRVRTMSMIGTARAVGRYKSHIFCKRICLLNTINSSLWWRLSTGSFASATVCADTDSMFLQTNRSGGGDSLVRATTTASSLEAEHDSGNIANTQTKATSNEPSSQGTSSCNGPKRQDTMRDTFAHTRYKRVSKMSSDSLLTGKVLDLEDELKRTKTAQSTKIDGLKKRVKKLEKKQRSRTHKLKRLYKVSLTTREISSFDDEALDKKDTSKHRRIDEINADEDIGLGEYLIYCRTELVVEGLKKDGLTEGSLTRTGEELKQDNAKKQKVEDDKESAELKQCLEIIPDDGGNVTIDATRLSSNKLLKNFDREDSEVLWRLVKDKFVKTNPVDYMDSFLLHNLKTMFEHHVEDDVWKNQQGLAKVLQVDYKCEMVYELLRLVKKQIKEGYRANYTVWMNPLGDDVALPPRDQRHQYLMFEGLQYTDADIVDFETRLGKIYKREVHGVQVFDWGLIDLMDEGLSAEEMETARDPMLRLRHMLIAYSIAGRSEALEKGAMISGGQFVARIAEHFGLLTKERLQGLTMIVRDLLVIDMAELVRLQICEELDDTWAWVASRLARQSDVAVGATEVARDVLAGDEGALANPSSMQVPQPPHAAPKTMTHRITRLEEEAFDNTLVGSSQFPYQRHTMSRTGNASTSTAQQDEQPDP
nr:hypothetical protein [Tanacetum cinerariifolium]